MDFEIDITELVRKYAKRHGACDYDVDNMLEEMESHNTNGKSQESLMES